MECTCMQIKQFTIVIYCDIYATCVKRNTFVYIMCIHVSYLVPHKYVGPCCIFHVVKAATNETSVDISLNTTLWDLSKIQKTYLYFVLMHSLHGKCCKLCEK